MVTTGGDSPVPRHRGRTPRAAWLVLLAAAGAALCLLVLYQHGSVKWPAGDLKTLALREAPLPENERLAHATDIARLAEQDESFRDWLVGLVCSDEVDIKLRYEALDQLLQMRSDGPLVAMARALVPWLKEGWDGQEEMMLHGNACMLTYRALLQTDLPVEELYDLARLIHPGGMPGPGPWPVDRQESTASMSDVEKKQQRRQEELLQYARGLGETKLMQRVEAEVSLPEGVSPVFADLPGLAEQEPALRKWLAGVVASPREDLWVRGLAFRALLNVHSDEAVRATLIDLSSWLWDQEVELNRDGRDFQEDAKDLMVDRLLLTNIPVQEALRLATNSGPFLDGTLETVALRYERGQTPWSQEQEARIQERAQELIDAQGGRVFEKRRQDRASDERFDRATGTARDTQEGVADDAE